MSDLKSSELHTRLASEFPDVGIRHRIVRALVNHFPTQIENDLGSSLFANSASTSKDEAREIEKRIILRRCHRLGLEIDAPITVAQLDRQIEASWHPELKQPLERWSVKFNLAKIGYIIRH